MSLVWVTNASTQPGPVVNSINAACDRGHEPTALHVLSNPKVADQVDAIRERATAVVEAYGGDLDVTVTALDSETDFEGIITHYRETIEQAQAADRPVAVDVTPGRKFMSAIAFQAGIRYEADHVFYLLVDWGRFYDLQYPEIPRPGTDLIDFTAVFG